MSRWLIRLVAFTAGAQILFITSATPSECDWNRVDLRGDWGTATFQVEVADTPDVRTVGLMYREILPKRNGMLFIFDAPRPVSFWMKNTLIPLDILFFDQRGVLTKKKDRAPPLSTASIAGGNSVLSVLEINGGLAELYGIKLGTEIRHPSISNSQSAWKCESAY